MKKISTENDSHTKDGKAFTAIIEMKGRERYKRK